MSEQQKSLLLSFAKVWAPTVTIIISIIWGVGKGTYEAERIIISVSNSMQKITDHENKFINQDKINEHQDVINSDLYKKHNDVQDQLNKIYESKYYARTQNFQNGN